jgi:membrane protease YdiL (CAAX protease family)
VRSMMNDAAGLIPGPLVPPPEKRVWGGWATAGFGAVIIIVFFVVVVFIMVVVSAVLAFSQYGPELTIDDFTGSMNSHLGLLVAVSSIVGAFAGNGLILAFIKVRQGAGIAEYLGLKRISWKALLVAGLITVGFVALAALFDYFVHLEEGDTTVMVNIYDTAVWPVLLWIAVVIFAPVFEEPLVRGFLLEGFRRSRLGLVGAIVLSSLIWTALHAGYSLYSLATIFVFGLVLGVVRYKTGSLWSTILMHALYNMVGMALIAFNIGG